MLLVNPKADVPIVQISVLASESPESHFAMGRALGKLRDSNIAIVGSGFASMHNLQLMFTGGLQDPAFKARNVEWNNAVTAAAVEEDENEREKKFSGWRSWPG